MDRRRRRRERARPHAPGAGSSPAGRAAAPRRSVYAQAFLVAAVAEPAAELAEGDHAREDQSDDKHRLDDLLALFGGGLREWEQRAERHPRATLPDSPEVSRNRSRNRVGPRSGLAAAEARRGRRPGLAVAGKTVRAQL